MLMIFILVSSSISAARGYSWNQLLLECFLDDDGLGSGSLRSGIICVFQQHEVSFPYCTNRDEGTNVVPLVDILRLLICQVRNRYA